MKKTTKSSTLSSANITTKEPTSFTTTIKQSSPNDILPKIEGNKPKK